MAHDATIVGPTRRLLVRLANGVARTLQRGEVTSPALDLAVLLEAAHVDAAVLADPRQQAFLARVQALIDDANHAPLHYLGRVGVRFDLVRRIANHFALRDWMASHPETAAVEVPQPVFIVGQPRTGTTLVYQLLAQDPQFRAPLAWELQSPAPPTDPDDPRADPRYRNARRTFRFMHWYIPALRSVHDVDADLPDECYHLLETSALSVSFMLYFDIPTYVNRLTDAAPDEIRDTYGRYREHVQVLQTHARGRQWISKSPAHLFFLDALLDAFPDARIIMTHRDPVEAIASLCSLVALVRTAYAESIDLHAVGKRVLDVFLGMCRRSESTRRRFGPQSFIDVDYDALVADPLAVVRGIYRRLDRPLLPAVERSMSAWIAENPRHKHGVHRYALEPFGLDPARVRAETSGFH